jgi:hypothetical protein
MDDGNIKSELLGLEKQYWQAMKDKDPAAAIRLTEFPCIIAGAQGVAPIDEKTFASMLNAPSWTLQEFALQDGAQVRLLTNDVAIVAYKVREKQVVEEKPVTIEASDTSVWVRRDGRWLCALHTESLAGDPFGRDRRPAH